jgi:indolepyruvate ferredoxin oxidoreductase
VRNYFKLLSYKDEYEVARLYTSGEFAKNLKAQFEGDMKLSVQLAPPLFARTDPRTGRPRKTSFGPWMFSLFKLLARMKGLRGTRFDPFGHTQERKLERRLITDYEGMIEIILDKLTKERLDAAIALAQVPDQIRGFGPVKLESIEKAETKKKELMAAFLQPTNNPPRVLAAE